MLVDGNKIAKTLEEKLATELLFSGPKKVCFIIMGEDKAIEQFVRAKCRVAERIGVLVEVMRYVNIKNTEQATEIVRTVCAMDNDAVVVQLPLPDNVDTQIVLDQIPPEKDIDVLGTQTIKKFMRGETNRVPPVAQAVREIFDYYDILIKGKKVVVVGQGRLVGLPVHWLLQKDGSLHSIVTVHTPLSDKLDLLKSADIVISGTGAPNSIEPSMIKEGVLLIDAGASEQSGKLVGDINPLCGAKASLFASVPGGIGPITVVSLFRNLTSDIMHFK